MTRLCPICAENLGAQGSIEKHGYTYSICSFCGGASPTTDWDPADYEEGYFFGGTSYGYFDYSADRRLHLETADRRLDAVAARTSELESVVDVGAALGFTLEAARNRGIKPVGVEVSDFARSQLERRNFVTRPNLTDFSTFDFDAVIFGQVLEHMSHPAEALATAYEILRPGGVVFIETWDFSSKMARRFGSRWQQISPPSVIHLFTRQGLRRMLDRTGFSDIDIRPWQKRVSVGGYLGVVAGKLPNAAGKALMSVARATRVTRIPLTYRFDDLIAVTARKPA